MKEAAAALGNGDAPMAIPTRIMLGLECGGNAAGAMRATRRWRAP
jgi:hypothetical protein